MEESFDLGALVEEFRDEAWDQVDRLDGGLIRLEREGALPDEERTELLRALHTLKGNAGMLGFLPIRDFVHVVETVLKSPDAGAGGPVLERLFKGAAALRRAVEEAGVEGEVAAFRALDEARRRLETPPAGEGGAGVEGSEAEGEGGGARALDRIRVPFEKLDTLLSDVGELLSEVAGVVESMSEAGVGRETQDRVEGVGRRAVGIRDAIMGLRLVPVGRVLGRFHGLVRRLAREQGKEASLVLEGEGTEVDKSTADALSDPLLHLVRNAIDHGIETRERREAAGKPRNGTIRIAAWQEGDGVVVVVEDDGGGLELNAIRRAGEIAGLVVPDAELTEAEVRELIFAPGVTTRADAGMVSGRGVGLDVVRRRVRDLRGELHVEPVVGGGTRFLMRLPLTVSVVPALVLSSDGEVVAVPTANVLRTLRLDRVERVGSGEMVRVEEELVPLIVPHRLFGWSDGPRGGSGVLLRHGHEASVLAVDRVLFQGDLMVKRLPRFGPRSVGVTGAIVRPGGRVILLLDPLEIMDLNGARSAEGGGA